MPRPSSARVELMTVEQVADYLQLNKLTVYKYIREGRLSAARLGKAYRIRRADVDGFLDRQMARPAAPAGSRPNALKRPIRRGRRGTRSEEIAVAPHRRQSELPREHSEVSINPMEWVIRGLH